MSETNEYEVEVMKVRAVHLEAESEQEAKQEAVEMVKSGEVSTSDWHAHSVTQLDE